jgi:NAD(P)H-dependent FMN reductase
MMDELYEEYNRKPIGICGTSTGRLGGARMVEALRMSVIELQMAPIRTAVYFSNIQDLFDQNGNIKDGETYSKRLKTFFDELIWYAHALKVAREQNKGKL